MSSEPPTPPREPQRAMQSTGEVRAMAELPARAAIGLAGGFLPPLVALAIAAVVGDLLILSFGEAPGTVFRLLIEGTWGNAYGIGQVLYKTTTLVCTGLAFALAGRAGLFNVGAEGQLAAGGFGAAVLGLLLPDGTPALLAVPLCLLAAMLAGTACCGQGLVRAK